ncbi:FRG domain-containing protein [Cardiobacterium valvarum]|uniref:FRG domain protein n=1 Tax=Cardiobacterium valvarum F0432 TaxID=797473 RepID=G9ZFA8_9GAMM|nr:FRG domain-containing protein [Cardiobacterium valvarum]EHM54086.1 FRG domain protein [Cardiobacterium valvarum F0432]
METTEINSISDLSKILQTLGEPEKGHTRFFRGHGDEGWQMLPSIYRAKHLIENEDKIIKDALTYCPDDFLPSDTLFEKLVKLQHYGYSTRLLDLTANALVALYFAAWNKKHHDKNGELIIFDIPNKDIKYDNDNAAIILSAISARSNCSEISLYKERAKNFSSLKIIEYIKDNRSDHEFIKKCFEDEIYMNNNMIKNNLKVAGLNNYQDFYHLVEITAKAVGDNAYLEMFNKQKDINLLLDDIHAERPGFRNLISPSDLECVLCVRAKLNNARISRQQGCFLLFGIGGSKTVPAAIPDEWQRLASNRQKILVKAESKSAIMQELQSFGISKRTLFPELEAQATEIMKQYEPQ